MSSSVFHGASALTASTLTSVDVVAQQTEVVEA